VRTETTMTNRIKTSRSSTFLRGAGKLLTAGLILGSVLMHAQNRPERRDDQTNYDRSDNGVSAGGKWTEYRAEDRMTAAKRVRFELPAENTGDGDTDQARIILHCTDGKLNLADFRPNVRIGRPDWPGFWGQPQMRVRVRADNDHHDHAWNWVNGHFLSMDKGTARELIDAHLFRIEFRTPEGPRIAEFSPAGLDLNRVRDACGLTPKKP
jgi:hypothetical protein